MNFTKNALAAFLLVPSVLVSANISMSGFLCGPNNGSMPPMRTFHDGDQFKVCVRPRNNYKVIELFSTTCSNPAGSLSINDGDYLDDVAGARGWSNSKANRYSMGFTGTVNEPLISGIDPSFTCTGSARAEYYGPCAVQTYTFPPVPSGYFYAGFCVTGATTFEFSSSSGFQWNDIQSLEKGGSLVADSDSEDLKWFDVSGSCSGRMFMQPQDLNGPGADSTINFVANATNREKGVKLCTVINAFDDNVKPWKDTLVQDGFKNFGLPFGPEMTVVNEFEEEEVIEVKGDLSYKTYCKTIKEPCPSGPPEIVETSFKASIELDTKVTMILRL